MKEQLIECLTDILSAPIKVRYDEPKEIGIATTIADRLIANGVTIQKQGCWMLDGSDDQWRCSECGTHAASWDRTKETGGLPMFCHGCGAKMYEDGEV